MGIHTRQREIEEIKDNYIKKSSCIILVLMALLVGAFIGNTVTMLYVGQKQQTNAVANVNPPSGQSVPHEANPEALAGLEQAAANAPTNAAAWVELGNFCFDHDLPVKAINAYERALELSPMQVGVWSDLGVMYRRNKQFTKAVEAFSHAASLDKTHTTARFNMGIVYLHDLGDRENALKAWKEVLAIDPDAKTPNGQSVAGLVADLEKQ